MGHLSPPQAFEHTLRKARAGSSSDLGFLLQFYRDALLRWARPRVPKDLRGRLSGSDLVQETVCEAQQNFHQFSGNSEREWAAWLRAILRHNLFDACRDSQRLTEGRPLPEPHMSHVKSLLDATTPSPESAAMRKEQEQAIQQVLSRCLRTIVTC